jgi:hypothetical protein
VELVLAGSELDFGVASHGDLDGELGVAENGEHGGDAGHHVGEHDGGGDQRCPPVAACLDPVELVLAGSELDFSATRLNYLWDWGRRWSGEAVTMLAGRGSV